MWAEQVETKGRSLVQRAQSVRELRSACGFGWADVREQLLAHVRIADLPDHTISEVVVNIQEHQQQHWCHAPRLLAEDVRDCIHCPSRNHLRNEETHAEEDES